MRIGGTEVILRGGARTDSDYPALLKTRPAIGTVLNHGDYDGFKSSLTRVALRKGYFDSEFLKSQLGVPRPSSGVLGYRLRQRRTLSLWPRHFLWLANPR